MTWRPEFWGASHPGLQRDRNEDAFLWMGPEQLGDDSYLWLVCDGMGGEAAGQLASSAVADRVREVYPRALQAYQSPHRALTEALEAANRRLSFMQETKPELRKMGSTAIAVAFFQNQLWAAYVGDSRLYSYAGGQLEQLSTDHTKFQRMIEAGVFTAADDRPDHPAHSVLLNVLGRSEMEVETLPPIPIPADGLTLLLCSDGLSTFVEAPQLSAALSQATPHDAVQFLLSSALPHSNDNITLQVIRFGAAERPSTLDALAQAHGVTVQALPSTARQTSSLPFGELAGWEKHQTGSTPRISAPADDNAAPAPTESPAETPAPTPQPAPESTPEPAPAATPATTEAPAPARPAGTLLLGAEEIAQALAAEKKPDPAPAPARPAGTLMLGAEEIEEAMAAERKPAATAEPARPAGTLLLGAEEIEQALASEQKPNAAPAAAQAPGSSAGASPAAQAAAKQPAAAQSPAVDAHDANTPPPNDPAPSDETPGDETPGDELRAVRWLIALAVLLAIVALIIAVLRFTSSPAEPPQVDAATETPADDDRSAVLPRRDAAAERGAYQEAEAPRAPDHRHTHDAMPAYEIRGGTLLLDAHEVTLAQLLRVADTDDALLDLVGADRALFEGLACPSDIAVDAHMPACATLPTATHYCEQVERRLASAADWRGLRAEDEALLARGYAAAEGAAPALVVVPPFVRAISGSFDGAPELLAPNDAQRNAGDLVLLQPRGDARITVLPRAAREMSEANSNPVGLLSFRCIADAPDTANEASPTPAAAPSPASAQPSSPSTARTPAAAPTPASTRTPSRAAAEAAPVAPRVNPPPEAIEDPEVSNDSFLLQRLRTP